MGGLGFGFMGTACVTLMRYLPNALADAISNRGFMGAACVTLMRYGDDSDAHVVRSADTASREPGW